MKMGDDLKTASQIPGLRGLIDLVPAEGRTGDVKDAGGGRWRDGGRDGVSWMVERNGLEGAKEMEGGEMEK